MADNPQGYHRLWSHRSYNASIPLQLFLLAAGTSAAQGSAFFWSRSHRSHHRYTDTDKDPYNANRGFWWNHLGWMVFITDLHSGPADASDLKKDKLLQLQHSWYFFLLPIWAIIVPTVIPGYFWGRLDRRLLFRDDAPYGLCSPCQSLFVNCFFFLESL